MPSKPQAKVKYDFNSPSPNELSIKAGEVVEVLQKETNGKPIKHSIDVDVH